MSRKFLIVQVAGLGHDFLHRHHGLRWQGLAFQPFESLFPALTCTAQAGFRTAAPISSHGMPANGWLHRELGRTFFWEQASSLVTGPRIWESFRRQGKRVALLFWQQSLGEEVDLLLSPAPIHRHGGGLVDSVYSRPAGLYADLCRQLGDRFRLHRYWGPLASPAASDWIARATAAILDDRRLAPELCLTYLPALDYDLQRYGPTHGRSIAALSALLGQLDLLRTAAVRNGYELLIFGDYAIGAVNDAVLPNVALRTHGLFHTRRVAGRLYPDLHSSLACAVVDHEVAHVYLKPGTERATARAILTGMEGVGDVLDLDAQQKWRLAHPRSGDLLLIAKPGYWFAYPWWTARGDAPDYAGHVDIHNKPGYDPCELFFGWPPPAVSQNVTRVRGSHGRLGLDRMATWAATFPLPSPPASLLDLAAGVRTLLEAES